jgi:hypothetical protein
MTPQRQQFRHKPDAGITGDCFRACIASLLDLSIDNVPHFYDGTNDGPQTPEQTEAIRSWFAARDMILIETAWSMTVEEALAFSAERWPGLHIVMGGRSPRGVNHVVIIRNGKMVHDPHPDEAGIVGPTDDGFTWLSFVGRLV